MSTTEVKFAKESRIGKKPIPVPAGVKIEIGETDIEITGPKGKLVSPIPAGIEIKEEA